MASVLALRGEAELEESVGVPAAGGEGELEGLPAVGEEGDLCKLKASVPTGLEVSARDEVREALGRPAQTSRGRVVFSLKTLEELEKVDSLRSVDNFWVVVAEMADFCQDETSVIDRLHQLPSDKDPWLTPLKVWSHYRSTILSLQGTTRSETERPVSFRVTCTRSGRKHVFSSNEAAGALGAGLNEKFGWKVQMKDFDLEVLLRIRGDAIEVGVALNRESKFKRNMAHFGPTSLRPTIAYSLLRLAEVTCGDIVADPLCGGGTISIEGSLSMSSSYHLAGDIHAAACTRTNANLSALHEKGVWPLVDVLQWDSTHLPLRDSCLDVVVTDLPFGKKMGSLRDNRVLYPKVLTELGRVCRAGARAVLLTHDNKTFSRALQRDRYWWRKVTRWVNLGGLNAAIYLLVRTETETKHQTSVAMAT